MTPSGRCDHRKYRTVPVVLMTAVLMFVTGAAFSQQDLTFPNPAGPNPLVYNNFYAVRVHTDAGESFTLFDAASFPGENLPWPDAGGRYGDLPGSSPEGAGYFLWIRRVGEAGAITYPLSFNRIREIRFMGPYGGIVTGLPRRAELTIDGETTDVMVREGERRFSGWFSPLALEPGVPSFTPAILVLTSIDEATGENVEQRVFVKTDGFLGGIDEAMGTYAMLWLRHDGVDRLEFQHDGSYLRCPFCGSIFYDDRGEVCPFDGVALTPQNP